MKARRVLVLGLAVLLAGCGSAATAAPPAATLDAASAQPIAGRYLAGALGVDAAYLRWKAAIQGKTRVSEIEGPAATYAADLTKFDDSLASFDATGQVGTDVAALIAADQVVIRDLNAVTAQTDGSLAGWAAKLSADGTTAIKAGSTVRTDIALPPN